MRQVFVVIAIFAILNAPVSASQEQDMKFKINGCINTNIFGGKFGGNLCMGNLQQQMEDQDLQLGALLPFASALAPAIGQGIAALINGNQLENLQALPEDLQWQALIPIATSLAPVIAQGIGKLVGGMDQQEQDLQWQALIPIATSLAPVVAQGIGALINGGRVQNLSQEDLQWGGLAGLAGALAPVAAQVIGGMLQTGGGFATVFGNALAGGMDQQQDLQLGSLIKLGLGLLGSQDQQQDLQLGSLIKLGLGLLGSQQDQDQDLQLGSLIKLALPLLLGSQQDEQQNLQFGSLLKLGLGLLAGQQQQDFGLFGSILKGGLKLAGKAARSPAGRYAITQGGKLAVDAADNAIRNRWGIDDTQQDLQLGGLLKLGLGLLAGQQQEDLGFKAGMKGGFSWGAEQDQDFGLFGSLIKNGLKLAGKAARSPAGRYAIKEGGKLALDAGKKILNDRFGGN